MATFSNSQKLAAVLSQWARPAISQIASSKLMSLSFMKSLQATIVGSGLARDGYNLANDIEPFVEPLVNALVTPVLERYIGNIPYASIPQAARTIIENLIQKGTLSILDGLITFDTEDLEELQTLINKNLPCADNEMYEVIN